MADSDDIVATAPQKLAIMHAAAEEAGRDPAAIGLQARLSDPLDLDAIPRRVTALRQAGFTRTSVSMPVLEAAGVTGIEAQVDALTQIRERILS